MTLTASAVAVVTFLASLVGHAFDVDVSVFYLAATTLGALLMALGFGLLALAIGGATGERGLAIGIAVAAPYLLSSLAPLVDWLKPWRVLSLIYWSVGNGQLTTGLGWDGLVVLVAAVTMVLVAAIAAFDRHDVRA